MAEKSPAPMATPVTRSEEAPRNSSKPRKKNEVPPPELLSKPVDICSHCNKKCKSKGVGSEAIQCDFCSAWVHAACEGLSKDDYTRFNKLISGTESIVYYCKLNNCLTRVKKFIFEHSQSPSSTVVNSIESLSNSWQREHKALMDSVTALSKKMDNLCSKNSELQLKINNIEAPINSTVLPPASSATNIVDELADRDRRKKNVIIYNLPEPAPDDGGDSDTFATMCSSVYNCSCAITKSVRLGKKVINKHRPLLLSLENEVDKLLLLSRSYLLRQNDSYKDVFIAPDRTKFEREKHKRLLLELKDRRSKGETNLILRNGAIISKFPAKNNSAPSNQRQVASSGEPSQHP